MKNVSWALIAAVASWLAGAAARAQDTGDEEPALDPAVLSPEVQSYYEGERISTYIVGGIGVAAVAAGIPLVAVGDDFAIGLGLPFLILGALQAIGAVIYAFQVGAQMDHYGSSLDRDPAAFRDEESEHMRGTIERFVFYQITELALTLGGAGLATYGFLDAQPLAAGIGVGVAALALPFFIIDLINQQRGASYADHVRRLDVSRAQSAVGRSADRFALPSTGDGFYLSFARTF
jgi:hypothetical protein